MIDRNDKNIEQSQGKLEKHAQTIKYTFLP